MHDTQVLMRADRGRLSDNVLKSQNSSRKHQKTLGKGQMSYWNRNVKVMKCIQVAVDLTPDFLSESFVLDRVDPSVVESPVWN
jgi:hypothetical protein